MAVLEEHQADVEAILARRRSNGADFWATRDGRRGTGSPFSERSLAKFAYCRKGEPSRLATKR
jgi:hypothetical protein